MRFDGASFGVATGVAVFDALDAVLVPILFVALTVKVYPTPLVSPATISGEDDPDAVKLPGFEVTTYPVIGEPPVSAGAVNVTVTWPSPGVAVPIVGASGTVTGVPLAEVLAAPVPIALMALTRKLYAVPFERPVTVVAAVVL